MARLEPEPAAEPNPELAHVNSPARITAVTTLAGVVAIGLLVAAGVIKASLDAKLQQRTIPQARSQVQREVNATNALFTASLGTGLAALAVGSASVIFWARGPASASTVEDED